MEAVSDDLIRRRKERLSAEAQALFNSINSAGGSGAQVGGPEFEGFLERISQLPPEEQRELLALLTTQGFGLMRQAEEAQEIAEAAAGAERVFDAAHEKLRAEGKPINPDMTLEDAYKVLGLA